MTISSNTIFITAIHPPVEASDDLAAMAAYLLTISAPSRDISNLITDDNLRSARYIGEHQSIGVPRGASGVVFVSSQSGLESSTAGVDNADPLQASLINPPEGTTGVSSRAVSPSGGDSDLQVAGKTLQDFSEMIVTAPPSTVGHAPEPQGYGPVPEFFDDISLPTSVELDDLLQNAEIHQKIVENPIGIMHILGSHSAHTALRT